MNDTQELLNKKVGTKETPKLEPKPVKIVSVRTQEKTRDGKDMKSPLIHLECKHPDRDDLISISKVKLERDGKLLVSGLWASLDEDKNLHKSSAVSEVLGHLKSETLADTLGKEMETVYESDNSQFLCLKAY